MATSILGLPLPLLLAVAMGASALMVVLIAIVGERERRAVLRRATGSLDFPRAIRRDQRSLAGRLGDWLAARVPQPEDGGATSASQLVHAGFDGASAPAVFALIRVVCALVVSVIALAIAPRDDAMYFGLGMAIAATIGLLGPTAVLDRITAKRQEEIRRGIPDALDLLVVCVEAGVALDAAVQRVARELKLVHPMLASELLGMTRRMSAGMPREQAMQSLYARTGVPELRGLASHLVQSEKWGTSIVTVLRVYAEQLRRRRRLAAEKLAATASTRMLPPLALFIFPTIFIVLLGPAMMRILDMFDNL